MKVLVFIDHDIICRHFVMNGALASLVRAAQVRFVFPDDGGKRVKLAPEALPLGAPFERLPVNTRRQQIWRWRLYADQLKIRRGRHERAIRRIRWKTLGWKASALLTLAGLPGFSLLFKREIARRLQQTENRALAALLDREMPDIVLHPTVLDGVFVNDLVAECRERQVPVIFAMNSWDNPSTKRAVVGLPDWLLVWGPQTKDHAARFVGLAPERIVEFGAAQFDAFAEPPRVDRAAFAAENGLDPRSRIVLFAGSNAQTDEFAALSMLDDAIERGELPGICVLYRPHPWGLGGRGGARLASANWRHVQIHAPMRDYIMQLGTGAGGMVLPDYRDTHDLLCSVDVVVSPLSTILVEAMLHAKPVVVYAPAENTGSGAMADMLPMLHFEEFLAVDGVENACDVAGLIHVLRTLTQTEDGARRGAKLRGASERFVTPFERPWRERIVGFLQERSRAPAAAGRERAA